MTANFRSAQLEHSGFISALNPQLGFPGAIVGPLDVPVLPQRVLVHRGDEIEGRLEFDVIESRFGRDELMPLTGWDEDEAAGPDRKTASVVLHFASAVLDEVKVLWCDCTRFRRVVNVPRRVTVRCIGHPSDL